MDQTVKLFLFFCFAVFFFAGCNKKSQQAEVNGPKSAATDPKKLGKVVPKETAEQIALTLAMLDEMGKIFQEVVPKAAGIKVIENPETGNPTITGAEVSIPKNIFQILSSLIQVQFTSEGQGQPPESAKGNENSKLGAAAQDTRNSNIKNAPRPVSTAACAGHGQPNFKSTRQKENDPKSTVFELYYNLCQEPKTSLKLATWQRDKNGDWQFVFAVNAFSQAGINAYGKTGASLEALGSGCALRYNEKEKHIDLMNCRVLSTDVKGANEVESTKSLYLAKIDFNRQSEIQVTLEGTLLDRSAFPPKELELVVKDIPKLNTLSVMARVHAETKKVENESDSGSGLNATATVSDKDSAAPQVPPASGESVETSTDHSQAQPEEPQQGQNGNESQPDNQENEKPDQPRTANTPPEAVT